MSVGQYGRPAGGINCVGFSTVATAWSLFFEQDWRNGHDKIELVGVTQSDKRKSILMKFTPKVGDPYHRYIDPDSYLMTRADFVQRVAEVGQPYGQAGAYLVELRFSDYVSDEGGVRFPRKLRANCADAEVTFRVKKVEYDALEDAVFAEPGGQ